MYFTTDRELARGWAVTRVGGGGSVYLVRPVPADDLELDADFVDPVGFSAPRAKIIEVAERTVYMSEDEAKRACCLKYVLWVDGSPAYDYEGFFQRRRPIAVQLARPQRTTDFSAPGYSSPNCMGVWPT